MQPRKCARTLSRIGLGLAALATAGLFNAAHATYPGENGVIVFDTWTPTAPKLIRKVSPGNSAVTDLGTGSYPSVSPDGKRIAFLRGTDVYLMNIDGSNVVQLTTGQTAYSPGWLPDGSKVVYGLFVASDKPIELWSVKPDGTGKTRLRQLDVNQSTMGGLDLAWHPFVQTFTFNGDGLSIGSVNGLNNHLVDDGSASSWAPDANSILFRDHLGSQFEIGLYDLIVRSVPSTGAVYGSGAISPDGASIAGGVLTNYQPLLTTRPRAGTPATFSWSSTVTNKADWSRVPKNCYASTPQGGGGLLANDVNFYAEQCAMAVMPDNGQNGILQQAIAIGPDKKLYHRALKIDPANGPPAWTPFAIVPGHEGFSFGITVKKIAIAAAKDGSAQVVVVATDDLLYHAMRYANGSWSGFNQLNGFAGAGNFAARDVAITVNASSTTSPGNAQVIANGLANGDVFHRVRWADGSWSDFAGVPAAPQPMLAQEIAIAADESGNTDILITRPVGSGGEGQIAHILRDANSNWGSWVVIGTPGVLLSQYSDVAVSRTLNGTAQLAFTDAAGNVLFQERPNPNLPASWSAGIASTTIIGAVGRTVSISAGATANSSSRLLLTRTFPQ